MKRAIFRIAAALFLSLALAGCGEIAGGIVEGAGDGFLPIIL